MGPEIRFTSATTETLVLSANRMTHQWSKDPKMNKKNIAIITAATLALGLGAWGVTSANASPVVKQATSVSAPTFTANDAP